MTIALITGASRGLGSHASRRLAAQGVTVLAGVRDPSELSRRLADEAPDLDIHPIALDVTDDVAVASAAKQIADSFGSIDVLVNNAGIHGTFAPAEDVLPEDLGPVFETNVVGPVRVTKAFLPLLRRGRTPRLIMVSSGMGSMSLHTTDEAYVPLRFLPYPASKAALNMIMVQYAKALPDVLVTAVDPGYTSTEFNGHSGPQTLDEGTDAIVSAVLDTAGPTGRYLDRDHLLPW